MKLLSLERFTFCFENYKKDFENKFPEMIKKLIRASGNIDAEILVPSYDQTRTTGFDGVVTNFKSISSYVPKNNSYWEIGTSKRGETKIFNDFKKRNSSRKIKNKKKFVFVSVVSTTLDTIVRQNLLRKMKAVSKFKTVKILDVNDIIDWLEENVDIAVWFLNQFSDTKSDVLISDVNAKWDYFRQYYTEKIESDFFLLYNEAKSNALKEKILQQKNQIIGVHSDDYGMQFSLYFTISTLLSIESLSLRERCIIVENEFALDLVNAYCKNKVVIIDFDFNNSNKLNMNNIYILFNLAFNEFKLEHIPSELIIDKLKNYNFDNETANIIAYENDFNPFSIIRYISTNPAAKAPLWYRDRNKYSLIPISIMENANLRFDGDKEILKLLCENLDEYINTLNFWREYPEPTVIKIDETYKINCKSECFKFIDFDYHLEKIKRLENYLVQNVALSKPRYLFYSENLISNIIESFRLIDLKNGNSNNHFYNFCLTILEESFSNKNTYLLESQLLIDFIQLCPSAFYNFAKSLEEKDIALLKLFLKKEENVGFKKNLSYFCYCLKKLCGVKGFEINGLELFLDFYFNVSNDKSVQKELVELLSPLGTLAGLVPISYSEKINFFINYVKSKNPADVYPLISLLLTDSDTIASCVSYGHINLKKEKVELTYNEIWDAHDKFSDWLVENNNGKKSDLIDIFYRNSLKTPLQKMKKQKELLVKSLKEIKDDQERQEIVSKIIRKIELIERGDEKQYLKEYIPFYNELLQIIKTNDYFKDNFYILLKDSFPIVNPPSLDDPDWYEKELSIRDKMRNDFINNCIKIYGKQIIIKIVKECKSNNSELWELIRKNSYDFYAEIDILINNSNKMGLACYLNNVPAANFKKIFKKYKTNHLFLSCLPLNLISVQSVDGIRNEAHFWENKFFTMNSDVDKELLIEKFLVFNPFQLVDHYAYREFPTLQIGLKILENLERFPKSCRNHDSYSIDKLIKRLDSKYNDERLYLLEYNNFDKFSDSLSDYPLGVKRYFWNNPEKFASLITNLSKSKENKKEIERKIAFDSLMTLGNSCFIEKEKMIVEKENFVNWINRIIDYSLDKSDEDKDRISRVIINILSACPFEQNEYWPTLEIASIVESLQNHFPLRPNQIASAFSAGYTNRRGVRTIHDGSDQYASANQFRLYSNFYKKRFPIMSMCLDYISSTYESEGKNDEKHYKYGRF